MSGLRGNVVLQPPAWAPNVDVELELSGALDPCEVLDFAQAVKSVAFSADGGCLAAGCADGLVRTVRIDTADRTLALCMALHPRLSASGAHEGLGLLDSDLLRHIVSLAPAESLRLGGNVARDDLDTGGKALVSAVAFAPDEACLAAATMDGRIVFFHADSLHKSDVEIVCGASHSIMSLVFLSSSFLASAGRDRVIRIWQISTGMQAMQPLEGHTGMIHALSSHTAHRAGRGVNAILASGSSDCTVRLWQIEVDHDGHGQADGGSNAVKGTARGIREPLRGHYRGIHSAAFSPGGETLAVASGDSLISVWDADGKSKGEPLKGHLSSVFCLAFSPDGYVLASGGDDRIVRLWCCR
jgi:WD40 repeat protein